MLFDTVGEPAALVPPLPALPVRPGLPRFAARRIAADAARMLQSTLGPFVQVSASGVDHAQHSYGTRFNPVNQQKREASERTLAGVFIARSEDQPEASNFLGLCENGIDGGVRHPLIGGLEIPGFDALQVLTRSARQS